MSDGCKCHTRDCILCEEALYRDLPESAACAILDLLSTTSYQPGETLFRESELSNYLFVLRDGQVKLSCILPEGREQIVGLETPGHMLGIHSIHDECYRYTATALSEISVCKVRHRDLIGVARQHPDLSMRLLDSLNDKLRQTRALICAMGHKTAMEKVASFLLTLIPAPDESISENGALALSRLEVAELLGLTEETVSRIIAQFRRLGMVDAPRGKPMVILNRAGLQDILDDTVRIGGTDPQKKYAFPAG